MATMISPLRIRSVCQRLLIMAAIALPLLSLSPANAQPPVASSQAFINYVFPRGGQRGKTIAATINGTNLQGANGVRISGTGVKASVVEVVKTNAVKITVTIDADAELGERDFRLTTPVGLSNRTRFFVGDLPEVNELEPNSEKTQAHRLESLPVLLNGQILEADRDFFRFPAKAGQTLAFAAQARAPMPYMADASPGWFDACLTLYDSNGKQLKFAKDFRFDPDPLMIFPVEKDGEYLIEIHDILYRGRPDFIYRLAIGELPRLTHIFPLGGQRNSHVTVELHGVNLPTQTVDVAIPADSPPVRYVNVTRDGLASNSLPLAVGDFPEVRETEPNDSIEKANRVEPPVTINGRIQQRGDVDYFIFSAQAKQTLVMEVFARRLESPLDSILTLFDAKGKELAENDDNVDPSAALVTHHADSRLMYTFPAAGDYVLRIKDVQGNGGEEYAYRLVIAPPRPDYALRVSPDLLPVGQGDTAMVTVDALRQDGFDGEISMAIEDLPEGAVVSEAFVPAKQNQTRLTISVPAEAPLGVVSPTFVGTAHIGEQPAVRTASAAEAIMQAFSLMQIVPTKEFALAVVEPTGLTLSTNVSPTYGLPIPQGGQGQVVVKAVRKEGMKGQVGLISAGPTPGVNVRCVPIVADKDEATITVTVPKGAAVGSKLSLVIRGEMQAGKETFVRFAPAIIVQVVAGPQ
jgi:hypothetical protein